MRFIVLLRVSFFKMPTKCHGILYFVSGKLLWKLKQIICPVLCFCDLLEETPSPQSDVSMGRKMCV